jgi:hypothetical protein
LSPIPSPQPARDPADSPVPPFPITPSGLGDKTTVEINQRETADSALIENLYGKIAAGDRDGLQKMIDTVSTPFQKALVIASLEHTMIQAKQPVAAEQFAAMIPQSDIECVLAKAETLSSAAAAWLRAGNPDSASAPFASAIQLLLSAQALPVGQLTVLASIAEAQVKGGFTASSAETLKAANQIASRLPLPPVVQSGIKRPQTVSHHRTEAYREIFMVALRAHDLGTARQLPDCGVLPEPSATPKLSTHGCRPASPMRPLPSCTAFKVRRNAPKCYSPPRKTC